MFVPEPTTDWAEPLVEQPKPLSSELQQAEVDLTFPRAEHGEGGADCRIFKGGTVGFVADRSKFPRLPPTRNISLVTTCLTSDLQSTHKMWKKPGTSMGNLYKLCRHSSTRSFATYLEARRDCLHGLRMLPHRQNLQCFPDLYLLPPAQGLDSRGGSADSSTSIHLRQWI